MKLDRAKKILTCIDCGEEFLGKDAVRCVYCKQNYYSKLARRRLAKEKLDKAVKEQEQEVMSKTERFVIDE